ncbi:MAG: M23 family metallopeptidase [Defluviitaleaceae bacterium]|nr:M23 family metallopeptidase [Defluviitaleaceae bacterium]
MSIFLRIIKPLWKIGMLGVIVFFVLGLFGVALPPVFRRMSDLLLLLIFLDAHVWLGLAQVFGNFMAKRKQPLPSAEDYDCAVDYILPFEGKWVVVNGGAEKEFSHSWGIIPQRYAYDFIMIDDKGSSFSGDNTSLGSYYCYGENIIAPANGTVVKVSNKHKDSRVTSTKAFCDSWDIRGNFVIIQHAEEEFSLCAHLMPGSAAVRAGDKVKQGQVIGKCGNSGNTSEPHLHFQLQAGKSFFASAGLPVSFVNVVAAEKNNYGKKDPRNTRKQLQDARGGRVFLGRGLEVMNGNGKSDDVVVR